MIGGNNLDINQMRYFIEICSCGSMSKASEKLHLSPQGLSLAIRRMEYELGCDLFYRKSSGLILTEIGQQFKTEAEAALRHVDNIYSLCSKGLKKEIHIACTLNLLSRLPSSLQQLLIFGTDDISVHTTENFTCVCEDMILSDEADLAIVYGDCDETLFKVTKLDNYNQVFIVNKQHPLAAKNSIKLAELANIPLIIPYDRCRPGMKLRQMFSEANIPLNIAFSSDRPRQIIDVVSANPKLGARIILNDVTEEDRHNLKILPLEDEEFLLPVCLIYKKGKKLNMQELFLHHLITDCY